MNAQLLIRGGGISVVLAVALTIAGASRAAEEPALSPTDGSQRAERWAEEMAAFEEQDAQRAPESGSVVFVGSSSIRLWDLAKWFPDLPVLNRGFGGSQISDSVHFADTLVVKYDPSAIVFYAGDNDIAAGLEPAQVHRDFQEFVAVVRESLADAPIVYIAIKPSLARWKLADAMRAANGLIAADCEKDDSLMFLDVWPPMLADDGRPRPELFVEDGLHMNDAGYQTWVKLLRPQLDRLLADRGPSEGP